MGAGRDCRYSGAKRGIGGIRGHLGTPRACRGCRGHFGGVRGCRVSGVIWGWQGL